MAGVWDHGDQRGLWSDSCFHRVLWLQVQDGLWGRKTCAGMTARGAAVGWGEVGGFGAHFQVKPAGFLRVEGVGWKRTGSHVLFPGPTQRIGPAAPEAMVELWLSPLSPADKVPCGSQGRRGGHPGAVWGEHLTVSRLHSPLGFSKLMLCLSHQSVLPFTGAFEGTFPTLHRALALLNDWFCQHPEIPSEDYLPALLTWMSSIYSLPKWLRSVLGNPTPCSPSSRIIP